MAPNGPNVKSDNFLERCREGFFDWIESHPRTGWYIAFCATLNVFLNIIDAFDLFS